MTKILITGRTGYIASSLYNYLRDEYDVTVLGRADVDLSSFTAVRDWFSNKYFDVMIHTAIAGGHRLYKDDMSVLDTNLKMYYNLLDNRNFYGRFINLGSGAEVYDTHLPYGMSKSIIRTSVLDNYDFYNVRSYGVFDENERDSRFIKANLKKYINREPMTVYENKRMDFFYMKDFIKVIKYYIESNSPAVEMDCSYETSPYLSEVLTYINTLSDYSVDIEVQETQSPPPDYVGVYKNIGLNYIGMYDGIKSVYESLTCKK